MDKCYDYDVVVCGGGIAGISAAIAASREGAKVCLLEKEYALGGLATLGLIVVYLPLCDGDGYLMTTGIAEELLKISLKYGPGQIPEPWQEESSVEERSGTRYRVEYNAASMIIAAEELLLKENVTILYDVRVSGVNKERNSITSVFIETKTGRQEIKGKVFIDSTGDADVCYFADEPTVDDDTNRRTGWYFSYNNGELKRRAQTDPIRGEIPPGSRLYSGTDIFDISWHCIDGRKMILEDVLKRRAEGESDLYPILIPTYHGLRETRRLGGVFEFSEDEHERVWFEDAIGMIGNWKVSGKRYSIPFRAIKAPGALNLYAAGRCCSAEKSGWDLTRVIPTCALTGEASGVAAAMQVKIGEVPEITKLQQRLKEKGIKFDPSLFDRTEK